jgi:hypothetical protein
MKLAAGDEGGIDRGQFFMPCRNAPKLLDPAKEPLGQNAAFIVFGIEFPNSSGISRQGDPVLAIHSTASTNNWLSAAV